MKDLGTEIINHLLIIRHSQRNKSSVLHRLGQNLIIRMRHYKKNNRNK